MKNKIRIWAALCVAACTITFFACDDEKDITYKGNLDLNLLGIKQASEIWDGTKCNVTTNIQQPKEGESQKVDNFSYRLNLALYQNRKAEKDATVDLVIAIDSLNKAIAMVGTSSIYDVFKDVELLPEEYYNLSASKMELSADSKISEEVELNVYSTKLITLIQDERKKSATFVLPIQVQNSSSYTINGKTNTIMFFFNVTYVAPANPEDYVADGEGVPDDHTLEGGYKLLWHDEFNGTGAPNAEMWRFEEGFQRNEEDQWYKKENAEMKENALVFTAKQERVKNPNYNPNATGGNSWKQTREYAEYTSACVVATNNYAFKYGRLIVRAKVPIEQGGWPAIWSTGNWYEWPLGGEIDILEFYKEKIHANLCWGGSSRWNGTWNSANYPITDFTSKDAKWAEKYHIWRMDWDEKYICIYLDDVLLNKTDLSTTNNKGDHGAGDGGNINPFSNNIEGFGQLMMLNLAIGGNNGRPIEATFPLEYRVDYVRVYQKQ